MTKARDIADGTRYVDVTGDTMSGTLSVPTLAHSGWGGSLDRAWGGYPSITINNNTGLTQTELRIHGDVGTAGGDFSIDLRVDGKYISNAQTQYNAAATTGAVTVTTTSAVVIASLTVVSTAAKPFLIIATGDMNPLQSGGWRFTSIHRNGLRVSRLTLNENAGGDSKNCPFANVCIDAPGAGTHTYTLVAESGTGSHVYGETGDQQAPALVAVEIL